MESNEVMEVKFESPAARKADGKRKLGDHKIGCAIAVTSTSEKIVGIISLGAENNFTSIGKIGNNRIAVMR